MDKENQKSWLEPTEPSHIKRYGVPGDATSKGRFHTYYGKWSRIFGIYFTPLRKKPCKMGNERIKFCYD